MKQATTNLVAAAALLLPCLPAQQTWVVAENPGPGVNFTDLPPAVAAAAPGDTILVGQTQSFVGYSPTVLDKGLTLIGSGFPTFIERLEILAVPANQRVVVQSCGVTPGLPPFPPALQIRDCSGVVLLEDVSVGGLNGVHTEISNSDQVTLRACILSAQSTPNTIVDSRVVADGCEFWLDFAQPGAGCIEATRSVLSLTGCYLRSLPPFFGANSRGLLLADSTLILVDCTLEVISYLPPGVDIEGVCGGGNSQLLLPSNPGPTSPPTTLGCVVPLGQPVPSTTVGELVQGQPATFRLYADSGSTMFLFLGLPAIATIPTGLGIVALDPTMLDLLLVAAIGSSGSEEITIPFVPATIPVGTVLACQSLAVDANLGLRISAHTMALVK